MRPIGDWSMSITLSTCSSRRAAGAGRATPATGRSSASAHGAGPPARAWTCRTADAGHADEQAERDVEVDVLEVVLAGAEELQPAVAQGPSNLGRRDHAAARQERPGDRVVVFERPLQVACRRSPRPRSRRRDRCRPRDRPRGSPRRARRRSACSRVPQANQGVEQPPVVPLVEPDRRLVKDVQDADQPAADLGGEPDPLRLAAGRRGRGPPGVR